ncbi:MAG: YqeG family HAD IIIA-type phosphatase [Candidatus Bipolaricaulia bacterium]
MMPRLTPHQHLSSVFELDLDGLRARGIRGVIFDLDNTLGPWGFTEWDERILRWLADVEAAGFALAFLSNDEGIDRKSVRVELSGYPLRFNAGKPGTRAFWEMLGALGMDPNEVAMVGDQIFTDVLGATRVGLHTVLVRPFDPATESRSTRVRRWLERQILRLSGQREPEARVSTPDRGTDNRPTGEVMSHDQNVEH